MYRARAAALLLLVSLCAFSGACGDPPEKEMQQAQIAIDAARDGGSDQYAHQEFTAAVEALTHAHEAADDRDYRQALNFALDARERAQLALKEAADTKAAAKVNAERALAGANTTLGIAQKRLAELEGARVSAKLLADPRKQLEASERRVQEARAAFDRGDFPDATTAAEASSQALSALVGSLESISPPAPRRAR
jgi:hypothetical protein